jgi:hypothetical protein
MTTPALNAFERIAARFDREFEMIAQIVSRGIGCEGAHRPMLEALIDRQDEKRPDSRQRAVV